MHVVPFFRTVFLLFSYNKKSKVNWGTIKKFKCGRPLKESSLKVGTTRAEFHRIQHNSIQVVAEEIGLENYLIRNVAALRNFHSSVTHSLNFYQDELDPAEYTAGKEELNFKDLPRPTRSRAPKLPLPQLSWPSCKCRVTQKLRNSSVLYHKTNYPFEEKICVKISFQLV